MERKMIGEGEGEDEGDTERVSSPAIISGDPGLSYGTNDDSLRDAFSGFGQVVKARVITDRDTGRSRGFGFVNFDSEESASSAVSAMDGQPLDERNIHVNNANDRPSAPRTYGSDGGGGYHGSFGDARENDGF